MSASKERILAFNPRSGNGININNYNRITELAKTYGYSILNLNRVFTTGPTNTIDQRLMAHLKGYKLVASLSGDGTFFTLLRDVEPGTPVVHLPNGGLNLVSSKLSGWENYSPKKILQAIADGHYREIQLKQGEIQNVDHRTPEVFHWTAGVGYSSDTLQRVNQTRKHDKLIRNILAGATTLLNTAANGQLYTATVGDHTIAAHGFDLIKADMPYFGLFSFENIKDLDLTKSDFLITYGANIDPQQPLNPAIYTGKFLQDAFQVRFGHTLPTHGMIDIIPIPQGSSVFFQSQPNSSQQSFQIDSEIYTTYQPLTATPSPDDPVFSTIIGK